MGISPFRFHSRFWQRKALEQLDTALARRADTDKLDGHAEVLFDEATVLLARLGELLKFGALCNVGLPAGEGLVDHLDLGEAVQVGYTVS